jgi:alanine-synthesizing transaminase
MFSTRVPSNRQPNRLARALGVARAAGRPLIDLTVSNPTSVGFEYPTSLLAPLGSTSALTYRPHPFGLSEARAAVAQDYIRRGIQIATDRIVLTASTSEAYSLLFKLLCGPGGDSVLAPAPSYPLFDHLSRLEGVSLASYRLEYHGRWILDVDTLDRVWTSRVRAVLAVSPNNPTGSLLTRDELKELDIRCSERDAALIIDEVFGDFGLEEGIPASAACTTAALTFRLGGLSKSAGLPQVKLGWIAVQGPDPLVSEALDRLELIADTYLSVSTPVQIAAEKLISAGAAIRQQILARIRTNYRELLRVASGYPPVVVLHADAGWSAVIRVPGSRSEEDLVLDLLERDGVLVHPGFFFDFSHEAFLVVSLLPDCSTFTRGAQIAMERASA